MMPKLMALAARRALRSAPAALRQHFLAVRAWISSPLRSLDEHGVFENAP